jgi:hypothetical protein
VEAVCCPTRGSSGQPVTEVTQGKQVEANDAQKPNGYPDRAFAFLTDEYGRLLRAMMLDPERHGMVGPERQFEEERLFWLIWATKIEGANAGQTG